MIRSNKKPNSNRKNNDTTNNEVSYTYASTGANQWNNAETMLQWMMRRSTTTLENDNKRVYYDAVLSINNLDENNKFVKVEDDEGNITYDRGNFNFSPKELVMFKYELERMMNDEVDLIEFNHVSKDTNTGKICQMYKNEEGFFISISDVESGKMSDNEYTHQFKTEEYASVVPSDSESEDITEDYFNVSLYMFLQDLEAAYAAIRGPVINIVEINTGSRSMSRGGGQVFNRPSRRTIGKSIADIDEDDDNEEEEVEEAPVKKSIKKKSSSVKKPQKISAKTLSDMLEDDDDDDE